MIRDGRAMLRRYVADARCLAMILMPRQSGIRDRARRRCRAITRCHILIADDDAIDYTLMPLMLLLRAIFVATHLPRRRLIRRHAADCLIELAHGL